jgi:translation initiation factor 5
MKLFNNICNYFFISDEAMDRLKLWLSDNSTHTVTQLLDELRNIQTMASLRPADRIIIYLGAVFSENVVTGKEIAAHKEVLGALAATTIQQRHLIAAFEWLCGTRYPSLVKYFPVLLKQLLDEELVEEDTFFAWAGDFARNEFSAEQSMMCIDTLEHLKASAAPFIKWLQEAEEEGDDDDDDEEEEEEDEDGNADEGSEDA